MENNDSRNTAPVNVHITNNAGEKKNTGLIAIIIVLAVCVLGLGAALLFNLLGAKDTKTDKESGEPETSEVEPIEEETGLVLEEMNKNAQDVIDLVGDKLGSKYGYNKSKNVGGIKHILSDTAFATTLNDSAIDMSRYEYIDINDIVDIFRNGVTEAGLTLQDAQTYNNGSYYAKGNLSEVYANDDGLTCVFGVKDQSFGRIVCGYENAISDERKEIATKLAKSFEEGVGPFEGTKITVMDIQDVKKNKSGSHELVTAMIIYSGVSVGANASFYRATGSDEWTFFSSGYNEPICSDYAGGAAEAYAGTECHREDGSNGIVGE